MLYLVMPPQCCICKNNLKDNEQHICSKCLTEMFLKNGNNNRMLIGKVLKENDDIEDYNSLFIYNKDNKTANIIHEIKYRNRPQLAVEFGRIAANELKNWFLHNHIDAIVPVPLHKNRLATRGYNQATMLATGIQQELDINIVENCLVRVIDNSSQTTKNAQERRNNVKGIFNVATPETLAGKRILLIDDVMTTGATIKECTRTLKSQVDNIKIFVFTLATAVV